MAEPDQPKYSGHPVYMVLVGTAGDLSKSFFEKSDGRQTLASN